MNRHVRTFAASVAVLTGSMTVVIAQGGSTPRDFDAEIRAALQSAKTAAGVEFTGVLSTNCLLPASGAENTTIARPTHDRRPGRHQGSARGPICATRGA